MELIIRLDQRKKEAKALINYIKSLPFVEVENTKPRYNKETEKAILDVKNGKATRISLADFRKQLYE